MHGSYILLFHIISCLDNLHLWSYEYNIIDIKGCALWDMIIMLVLFQCQVANVGQILVMLLGRWLDAKQGCIDICIIYIWYTVCVLYLQYITYVLSVTIIYHIPIYLISHIYMISIVYSHLSARKMPCSGWISSTVHHYYFFGYFNQVLTVRTSLSDLSRSPLFTYLYIYIYTHISIHIAMYLKQKVFSIDPLEIFAFLICLMAAG